MDTNASDNAGYLAYYSTRTAEISLQRQLRYFHFLLTFFCLLLVHIAELINTALLNISSEALSCLALFFLSFLPETFD